MVDTGLSLGEIGLLLGVVSYSAGILGAIVSGLSIAPLGRKRSLILFGSLRAIAISAYFLPAFGLTDLSVLYLVAIVVQISISMATTPLYTIMMDKSNLETAGTDYTMQNSIVHLGGIIAAAMSGIIARVVGYQGVFAVSIVISIIGVVLIAKIFDDINHEKVESKLTRT